VRTRSLTDLISDVRLRTDMVNSTFVSDAEITEYINQELAELWGHIVQSSGQPHYRSSTSVSVVAGTAFYPLPSDFWQVQGVEATIDGIIVTIRPFMAAEHAAMQRQARYPYANRIRYRVQAGNIEFQPTTDTFPATLFYTPSCPRLVSGGDTFDGFNGYEVAAIYGACAILQSKEETDPSFYEGRKAAIYRQIDSLAAQRDASEPERVQDVTGENDADRWLRPWGFWL